MFNIEQRDSNQGASADYRFSNNGYMACTSIGSVMTNPQGMTVYTFEGPARHIELLRGVREALAAGNTCHQRATLWTDDVWYLVPMACASGRGPVSRSTPTMTT